MENGFFAEQEFAFGVPMVPKPKSEAWLICALKDTPYQNCAALEETLSGNDHSPNPAKTLLDGLLENAGKESGDLSEMVETGEVDPGQIDMPSFHHFKSRLSEVLNAMLRA